MILVNLPSPCPDEELPVPAMVTVGGDGRDQRVDGGGGGAFREHRANPRSVGIVGGDCGSD